MKNIIRNTMLNIINKGEIDLNTIEKYWSKSAMDMIKIMCYFGNPCIEFNAYVVAYSIFEGSYDKVMNMATAETMFGIWSNAAKEQNIN